MLPPALRRMAAALGAAALVVVALPGTTAAPAGAAPVLLPDLVALPPRDVEIIKVKAGKNTETRLRLDTRVANVGPGPLELYPVSEDCNGDCNVRNDRTAYQRTFTDTNGDGTFQRGVDTPNPATPVGCMVFHAQHHHWHVAGFAAYRLEDAAGNVVRSSEKVSLCMLDMEWLGGGSRPAPYYTACGRTATMGISPGWADESYSTLAGQYINITGLGDGDYCLVNVANYAPALLDISEANTANNGSGVRITISGGGTAVSPRNNGAACGP